MTADGAPPIVTGLVLVGVSCRSLLPVNAPLMSVKPASAVVSAALVAISPTPVPNVSVCVAFDTDLDRQRGAGGDIRQIRIVVAGHGRGAEAQRRADIALHRDRHRRGEREIRQRSSLPCVE